MRHRVQGNRTALCAHPGCRKTIREGSWNFASGLCIVHQPEQQAAAKREGRPVRVVMVPYPTSNSGVALRMPVSLPAFPWEVA